MGAIETVDATGQFLHLGGLTVRDGQSYFRLGTPVTITIRRSQSPNSELVRRIN
jgi:hypothetical protein